jgi:DNA-binding response OmpR family regulator
MDLRPWSPGRSARVSTRWDWVRDGTDPTALIVEPDDDTCELYVYLFGLMTPNVVGVADADAAREAISRRPPQLLVIELHLGQPDDGFALIDWLRSQRSRRECTILVVTTLAFADTRERALCAGADEVFFKPCDVGELFLTAARLLRATLPGTTAASKSSTTGGAGAFLRPATRGR